MARKSTTRAPRNTKRQKTAQPSRAPRVEQAAGSRRTVVHLLIVAGLCAAILAVYWNALGNGFVADDHVQIEVISRTQIHAGIDKAFRASQPFAGHRIKVEQLHYRPLFWVSLALDHLIWGANPFGYHLTNLLLHMANACLLYGLLWRLFSRPLLAATISVLWALHPIQAEAVAWASGRVIALATFFLLVGLNGWLHASRTERPSARYLGLGLAGLSFFPALLSHEIAATYPLLLLWIAWYREGGSLGPWRTLRGRIRPMEAILILAPLAAYLAIRLTIAPFGKDVTGGGLFVNPGLRLVVILLTVSTYLRLLLFPVSLSLDHFSSINPSTTPIGLWFWLAMALLGAMVWVALRLRIFSRSAFFGVGWFVLTLLPVSNLIPLYWGLSERYLYLSSAGFCITLVTAATTAADRLRRTIPALASPVGLAAPAVLLALLYGGRTALRNRDWRSDFTLAVATATASPRSDQARGWLGQEYQKAGRHDLAIEQFSALLQVNPNTPAAYSGLGKSYEAIGRNDLAREAFRKAAQLNPTGSDESHELGLFYQRHGEADKAFEAFDRAVQRDPRSVPTLNALAAATLSKGDLAAARALLERVLALEPTNAVAQANLGALYVKLGKPEQALAAFQAAATADPNLATAHYNLGLLYRRLGQPERAQAAFREAERLDPGLRREGRAPAAQMRSYSLGRE